MSYASWGARLGAYLIDALIVFPIVLIGYLVDGPRTDVEAGTSTGGGPVYWLLYLIAAVLWGYNRWFLAGRTGQSWGRRALSIRLVGERTGEPIGAGMAFVRDLAHVVDALPCYVGYLWPIWDAKKQTFSDKIVKTLVLR